jgi:glycosyltransferase involved in cell wall biosynthesis
MNARPFLSVIIPTHNRLALLKKTLSHVRDQTYPQDHFEIIVVDDGSQDGTSVYLTQLAQQNEVKYIRQDRSGPAASRNAGAQEARGEILVFTDDDCLPEPNWLTELATSYTVNIQPNPVAVGGRIENIPSGHWIHKFYAVQSAQHRSNHSKHPSFLDTANASFKRSQFLAIGGFDKNYQHPGGEDVDLGFRYIAAGFQLQTNQEAIVLHVGPASFWGYLKRCYLIGFGTGFLMSKYPQRFSGVSRKGFRKIAKQILEQAIALAWQSPGPAQPYVYALSALFRRVTYDIAGLPIFVQKHMTKQIERYRLLKLTTFLIMVYILVEICGYLSHLIGQALGTLEFCLNQAKSHQRLEKEL